MDQASMSKNSERIPRSDRPLIEVQSVDLEYVRGSERTLALKGTTFGVEKGEFTAIVGPSGCGKSSLMKLITGLRRPTSGNVRVDSVDVQGPVAGVGMAFQNPTLMPWRTTLNNLMLPFEIVPPHKSRLRSHKAEYLSTGEAILSSVGLGGLGDKYPWELSGGMQQRASLCRALIHQPRFVMLDEPFAALDAFTREELWGVVQSLWMDRHFSAVLITHDLREAVYLADTVHVMSRRPGRIVASRRVNLPRPRTIETTFSAPFIELVHELRDLITREQRA